MIPFIDPGKPGEDIADRIAVICASCKDKQVTDEDRNGNDRGDPHADGTDLLDAEVLIEAQIDDAVRYGKRQYICQFRPQ